MKLASAGANPVDKRYAEELREDSPAINAVPSDTARTHETLEWLPRLAHDLRSPLVAIGYAAQMLRSGRAPAQKTGELFDSIDRQTTQLACLAEEIGDMLLISRDRFILQCGTCDLAAVAREAAAGPRHMAAVASMAAHSSSLGVRGDRTRLVQLIRHVIKFCGRRKAGADLPLLEVDLDAGHARVRLVDPGRSIYRSDALKYLAEGLEPIDPGILSMSDVIARRVMRAHDARLLVGALLEDRTDELALTLPVA